MIKAVKDDVLLTEGVEDDSLFPKSWLRYLDVDLLKKLGSTFSIIKQMASYCSFN